MRRCRRCRTRTRPGRGDRACRCEVLLRAAARKISIISVSSDAEFAKLSRCEVPTVVLPRPANDPRVAIAWRQHAGHALADVQHGLAAVPQRPEVDAQRLGAPPRRCRCASAPASRAATSGTALRTRCAACSRTSGPRISRSRRGEAVVVAGERAARPAASAGTTTATMSRGAELAHRTAPAAGGRAGVAAAHVVVVQEDHDQPRVVARRFASAARRATGSRRVGAALALSSISISLNASIVWSLLPSLDLEVVGGQIRDRPPLLVRDLRVDRHRIDARAERRLLRWRLLLRRLAPGTPAAPGCTRPARPGRPRPAPHSQSFDGP